MKKIAFFACLLLGLIMAMAVVGIAKAQTINVSQGGAHLEVTFTQTFNHVAFSVTWVTNDPNGAWPFLFGDGTETVISGESGVISFTHDYAYDPGGIITYNPSFTLGDWTDPWTGIVTIDDRDPVTDTFKVFLPIVSRAPIEVVCDFRVAYNAYQNNLMLLESWCTNVPDGYNAHLKFDTLGQDDAECDLLVTDGKTGEIHAYPYPYTDFLAQYEFTDTIGTAHIFYVPVHVNWP